MKLEPDEYVRSHKAFQRPFCNYCFDKCGKIAGGARENLEIESGDKVVSPEHYLTEPESRKRLKGRK